MFVQTPHSGSDRPCHAYFFVEGSMKKLLLASVALTVAATAAMAADASVRPHKRYVKAPIYKAQPMVFIPPVYDWSGSPRSMTGRACISAVMSAGVIFATPQPPRPPGPCWRLAQSTR